MPSFVDDAVKGLLDLLYSAEQSWHSLSVSVRIVTAMAIAAIFVLLGSRAESTGWSTFLFFLAFGFFSYVLAVGMFYVR